MNYLFKKEHIKVSNFIQNKSISGNVLIQFKSKSNNINLNDLTEIYIIWNDDIEPYIIKCPVVSQTLRSYIINVKSRSRYGKDEYYKQLKIAKKDINQFYYYKASSSYEIAFTYLLLQEKGRIIYKLKQNNDIELYKLFLEAAEFDLFLALEMIAKELNMDYLFRLDDDTKIEKE